QRPRINAARWRSLPGRDETPGSINLTLQQRSSGAVRAGREAADVDLDPIDVDLDHDHMGVGKAGWKMNIQAARPHGSHFRDIRIDARASTQCDVAVAGGVLKCEGDEVCRAHLGDLARASAD